MKTLYILRHAKADKEEVFNTDKQRTLHPKGWEEIDTMAKKLATHIKTCPESIVSSNAIRTIQTIGKLAELLEWDAHVIEYDSSLYHSSLDNLNNCLYGLEEDWKSVMLVGHNPGLTYLVNYVSSLNINTLPTCGCVGIEFDTEYWHKIEKKNSRLLFFEQP